MMSDYERHERKKASRRRSYKRNRSHIRKYNKSDKRKRRNTELRRKRMARIHADPILLKKFLAQRSVYNRRYHARSKKRRSTKKYKLNCKRWKKIGYKRWKKLNPSAYAERLRKKRERWQRIKDVENAKLRATQSMRRPKKHALYMKNRDRILAQQSERHKLLMETDPAYRDRLRVQSRMARKKRREQEMVETMLAMSKEA